MIERWKDIKGYENQYQVSTFGRVRSLPRITYRGGTKVRRKGTIIKPGVMRKGYLRVNLHRDGHVKGFYTEQLVAQAFIPNPHHYKETSHIDENKKNNRVDNLEWCDRRYNVNYGHRNEKAGEASGHSVTLSKNGKSYTFPSMTLASSWIIAQGYSKLTNPRQMVTSLANCAKHKPFFKHVFGFTVEYAKPDDIHEVWKDVPNYEGLYQVSNTGKVRREGHYIYIKQYMPCHELRPRTDKDGYYRVGLYKHRHQSMHRVNRLVATTFLPNPKGLPEVNHRNENRKDNRLENLEWCSSKYNCNYGKRTQHIIEKEGHALDLMKDGKSYHFPTIKSAVVWLKKKQNAKGKIRGIRNNMRLCLHHRTGYRSVYGYVPRFVDDEWKALSIQPLDA